MTDQQLQRIHQKAKDHAENARKYGTDFDIPGDPWANDSLAKVIKTKDQADRFMQQLKETIKKAES